MKWKVLEMTLIVTHPRCLTGAAKVRSVSVENREVSGFFSAITSQATSNKCLTSSNKKLLVTSASLVVTRMHKIYTIVHSVFTTIEKTIHKHRQGFTEANGDRGEDCPILPLVFG